MGIQHKAIIFHLLIKNKISDWKGTNRIGIETKVFFFTNLWVLKFLRITKWGELKDFTKKCFSLTGRFRRVIIFLLENLLFYFMGCE